MYVALGSDHHGVAARLMIAKMLQTWGDDVWAEYGPVHEEQADDYPVVGWNVAEDVRLHNAKMGILICGTGAGMCVVANKCLGIRAAVCRTSAEARQAREHANCNVLCLGKDTAKSVKLLSDTVEAFIYTQPSAEERHQSRVAKIRELEEKQIEEYAKGQQNPKPKSPKEVFDFIEDDFLKLLEKGMWE